MKRIGVCIVFLLCLFGLEMVKSEGITEDLQNNLLRLHIIANSDSENDQKIKLDVRDALLKMGEYDEQKLSKTANGMLEDLKTGYRAKICYRSRYVPVKSYKNIALPEGEYACLDVILGEGRGENWWCIAYPPLCFTEAVSGEMSEDAKKALKSRLSSESLSVILKNEDVTYKFKIVEEFQKIIKFLE
ncbi:MAG: stage II sporulation protein R [Clostridia bacterium]|nr:stage II sporulation protein R [Clostridia bacterium]